MNTNESNVSCLNRLSWKLIGAAYAVSNNLGCGFVEKVYENALAIELSRRGIRFRQQAPLCVRYQEEIVGEFFADLLIEDELLVELKATQGIDPAHEAQCLNYLRASGLSLCVLLNFGRPKVAVRRFVSG